MDDRKRKNHTAKSPKRLHLESLETRILYSADALASGVELSADNTREIETPNTNTVLQTKDGIFILDEPDNLNLSDIEQQLLQLTQDTEDLYLSDIEQQISQFEAPADQSLTYRTELIIVNNDIDSYQSLINNLEKNSDTHYSVLILDSKKSGFEQLLAAGTSSLKFDAIHLFSHGSNANINIGSSNISPDSIDSFSQEITTLGSYLSENGDLLIYGCNTAENNDGRSLIDLLSILSGADITVSNDLTGSSKQQGNWILEESTGDIESATLKSQWNGTLASTSEYNNASTVGDDPVTFTNLNNANLNLNDALISEINGQEIIVNGDPVSVTGGEVTLNNNELTFIRTGDFNGDITFEYTTAVQPSKSLNYQYFSSPPSADTINNIPKTGGELGTVTDFNITNLGLKYSKTDNFSVIYTGKLHIETSGVYNFYNRSDDGSSIVINGNTVLNNDGVHDAYTWKTSSITLSSGFHDIEIPYFEKEGYERLLIEYEGADTNNTRESLFLDGVLYSEIPPDPITTTANITVIAANTPPSLNNTGAYTLTTIETDIKESQNSGASVLEIMSSTETIAITDEDNHSETGIAITGVNNTGGDWEFSIDHGINWSQFSNTTNESNATLLGENDLIRFSPTSNYTGSESNLSFKAWDQTTGSSGEKNVDTTSNHRESAFSKNTATATIIVIDSNDRPTIDDSITHSLATTDENTTSETMSVADFLTAVNYDDVDASTNPGIAITSAIGLGQWQYSADGSVWKNVSDASLSNALLLQSSSLIRYIPNNYNSEVAQLGVKAWDGSSHVASSLSARSSANITENSGISSAFSAENATINISITEIENNYIILDSNLVKNPTFINSNISTVSSDSAPNDWKKTNSIIKSYSTGGLIHLQDDGGGISQVISDLIVGETYYLSFDYWERKSSGKHTLQLKLIDNTGDIINEVISLSTTDNNHRTFTFSFTATETEGTLLFKTITGNSSTGGRINDVSISQEKTTTTTPLIYTENDSGYDFFNHIDIARELSTNIIKAEVKITQSAYQEDSIYFDSSVDNSIRTFSNWDSSTNTLTLRPRDYLGSKNTVSIVWSSDAKTLTIEGTASISDYADILSQLRFTNSSDNPGTETRSIQTILTNGVGNSEFIPTTYLKITAVSDAPTITTTATNSGYTEDATETTLYANTNIDTIESSDEITSITVDFSGVQDDGDEFIIIDGNEVKLIGGINGVTSNNNFFWNITKSGTTGTITITHTGISSALAQTIIDEIKYLNKSQDPTTGTREFSISKITDSGTNNTSTGDSNTTIVNFKSSIDVTAISDQPELLAITATNPSYLEGSARETLFSNANITTVEASDLLTSLTISVSGLQDSGEEILTFDGMDITLSNTTSGATSTNGFNYTTSYLNNTATITISHPGATEAEFNALIDSLKYINTSTYPAENDRIVTLLTISDNATENHTATINQSSTLSVTATNDAPVIITSNQLSITENTSSIATIAVTDERPASVTFALSGGTDESLFNLNPTTGDLSFKSASNFEDPKDSGADNIYDIEITITDEKNSSTTKPIKITVTNINEFSISDIIDGDTDENTIAENASIGSTIDIRAYASDEDSSDTITYSHSGSEFFAVDPNTGRVTIANALNAETATTDTITITATSSDGSQSSATTFTINITDIDEFNISEITDNDPTVKTIFENLSIDESIGIQAFANDADISDTVSYSLSGNALFSIDNVTGIITVAGALDAETSTTQSFTVEAQSSDGTSQAKIFTLEIIDINEYTVSDISDTDINANSISENTAIGTSVGIQAFATDADISDTVSYSLSGNSLFSINSVTGVVIVAGALDAETSTTQSFTVEALSSDGSTSQQKIFTLDIHDINEFDISIITDSNNSPDSLLENTSLGSETPIRAFANDNDISDTITYSLSGNSLFNIDSATGIISLAGTLDAESGNSQSFTVNAISSDGSSAAEQSFTLNIIDENEFPISTISDSDSASNIISENAPPGTAVGVQAFAIDNDATDTVTYSLMGNNLFTIDSDTGIVTLTGTLDAEYSSTQTFTINAISSDGSVATAKDFTIDVADINESSVTAVTDSNLTSNEITENSNIGSLVGIQAMATDADIADNVSYSLSGNSVFNIDPNTGIVSLTGSIDAETATTQSFTVTATSTDGSVSSGKIFTVNIIDVDEYDISAIVDGDNTSNTVSESALVGSTLGIRANAIDEDASDSVSYNLSGNTLFTIDSQTGIVTLTGALDAETATTQTFTVHATSSDGSIATPQSFTVNISDINEFDVSSVSDSDLSDNTISENTTIGSEVGIQAIATDGDITDTITYSLSGNSLFNIDINTGIVTLAGSLDAETATTQSFSIQARSSDNSLSSVQTFTVNIEDVNEFDISSITDIDATMNSVSENAAIGSTIGVHVNAIDNDLSDTVTYSLTGNSLFNIDSNTGIITVAGTLNAEAATTQTFTVQATSSDSSVSAVQAFTVNIIDTDEFSISEAVDSDNSSNTVSEAALMGTEVGIQITATDSDTSDTVSYSLSDNDLFSIDAATGVVTVAGALDAETATIQTFTIVAISSDGSSSTPQTFSVNINDVNEFDIDAIIDSDNTINSVSENTSIGTTVGIQVNAIDNDVSDTATYSLSGNSLFDIDSETGIVTVAGALDAETAATQTFTILATSSDGSSSSPQTFSVNITDVDEFDVSSVSDNDSSINQVLENSNIGTVIGIQAFAVDNDITDSTTYSLSGNDLFSIDSSTGIITVAGALDAETATTQTFTVQATSSDGSVSALKNFTVNIIDVDETAISAITDSNSALNSVAENSSNNTAIGITALATDEDTTSTIAYTISDNDLFTIDSSTGVVSVNGALNAEQTTSQSFTVVATSTNNTNGSTSVEQKTFTVTITDINESGITAIIDNNPAIDTIAENAAVGSNIGITANATDADITDSVSYELIGNSLFSIDNSTGVVTLNGALDAETAATQTFSVQATSSDGSISQLQSFTITVTDTNEYTVSSIKDSDNSENSISENALIDSTVGIQAYAVDYDLNDSVTYSLSGNSLFKIDTNTGVVTLDGTLDAEMSTTQSFTVTATSTDNGIATEQDFTINIIDVNESGISSVSDNNNATNTLAENAVLGSEVGIRAYAIDADITDTVTYSLTGNSPFTIDSNSGIVTLTGELDAETATTHTFEIQARSSDGSMSASQEFTVNITDINEFAINNISDNDSSNNTISENAALGSTIGVQIHASDQDINDSVSYSLIDSDNVFIIDSHTGIVSLNGTLNAEAFTTHTFTVKAHSSDGSETASLSITVNITDVNEFTVSPVTDSNTNENRILENAPIGTIIDLQAQATDEDVGDSVSYSLNGNNLFTIDSKTGAVSLSGALDAETAITQAFTLQAHSSDGSFSEPQSFSINVVDVNEFSVSELTDNNSAANTVLENATTGSLVGMRAFAVDHDTSDSITYSLSGNPLFTIDSGTGTVTLSGTLDAETAATQTFTVTATSSDGGLPSEKEFTININDVDEFDATAIIDTDESPESLFENSPIGTTVGFAAFSSDGDIDDSIRYQLNNNADNLFSINPETGIITVNGLLDADTKNTHNLIVLANSTDGSQQQLTLTITVINENDITPTAISQTTSIGEHTQANAFVIDINSQLTQTDVDIEGDKLSYSIMPSSGSENFSIDSLSGIITLSENAILDHETTANYSLKIIIDDGLFQTSTTININISDENDIPVISGNTTDNVIEDDTTQEGQLQVTGELSIIDADMNQSFFQASTEIGALGTLNINKDGQWNYSVDNSLNTIQFLDSGEEFQEIFEIQSLDGSTENIFITIHGKEDHSVVLGDFNLTIDETSTIAATGTLSISDVDYSDTPLHFEIIDSIEGQSNYGVFTYNNNQWKYSIDNDTVSTLNLDQSENINDSYTFTASDGTTQTVSITINGIEDTPTGRDSSISTNEDSQHIFSESDFPFNDLNNDNFSGVKITALPSNGQLSIAGDTVEIGSIITTTQLEDKALIFSPSPNDNGDNYAQIVYQLFDGSVFSAATYTITVNVTAIDDRPIITTPKIDAIETKPGSSIIITNGNNEGIKIKNIDSNTALQRIVITIPNGELSVVEGKAQSIRGQNSQKLILIGTSEELTETLKSLSYLPLLGFSGEITLKITATDVLNSSGDRLGLETTTEVSLRINSSISIPEFRNNTITNKGSSLINENSRTDKDKNTLENRVNNRDTLIFYNKEDGKSNNKESTPILDNFNNHLIENNETTQRYKQHKVTEFSSYHGTIKTSRITPWYHLNTYQQPALDYTNIDFSTFESISSLRDGTEPDNNFQLTVIKFGGMAIGLSTFAWALRGSSLLASLATTVPAWRTFDPYPIFPKNNPHWGRH